MQARQKSQSPQFVEAVTPALESLLSDLQRTTEVLRRANERKPEQDLELGLNTSIAHYSSSTTKSRSGSAQKSSSSQHHNTTHYRQQTSDEDIDPIYQEQNFHRRQADSKSSPAAHHKGSEQSKAVLSSNYHQQSSSTGHQFSSQRPAKPHYPATSTSDIDSMMGSLQVDMDRHGIHTIPKGDCASCGQSIVGQVVIALGKMWHPEHYVCCHCGDEIGHRNFFERGGKAYCENDYHDLFSPRCAYCNGPIRERCITALGKTFHPEHFVCGECGRQLAEEGFHERNGAALCKEDFYRMYAPKCQGCGKAITSRFVTALQTHWHPDCFICQVCGMAFNGAPFFTDDASGMPLCEQHYHEKRGSLCSHCHRPIQGRCVSAMGRKFHPEHFFCSYCQRQLYKGTFKEHCGKAFCSKCFERCCS